MGREGDIMQGTTCKSGFRIVLLTVLFMVIMMGTSCATIIDDAVADVIQSKLGYTDEEIQHLEVTPQEGVKLNKLTAMMVGELTKLDFGTNVSNPTTTAPKSTFAEKVDQKKTDDVVTEAENQIFAPEEIGKSITVKVPVDGGEIDMVMVWPKGYENMYDMPLVMYTHGGSFSSGSYHTYERMVSIFANELGAIVAFPEYRLAPKYQFPVATEDVFSAWKWLCDNAYAYDIDTSRMTIAGDSAGGNLTAGLSLRLYENNLPQPDSVVLLYPNLTLMENVYPSRYIFGGIDGKVYIISGPAMVATIKNYLGDPARATEPYASPLIMLQGLVDIPGDANSLAPYAIKAKKPVVLAPTLLVVAQCDPLRDEAILYGVTLNELGTETQLTVYDGVSHGFPMFDKIMVEARQAMDEATSFVRHHWE